ncbi:MAG: fliJ [Clostridiales bacterium]|jgi:flagellar FliJ protein|nr:fliJ [Clostridiales bacterium]
MEAFNFQLQKVLDYKEKIEEKKKEEFVKALKFQLAQEKELNHYIDIKNDSKDYFYDLKTSGDFQNFSRYIEFLDKKIENAKYKLVKATEQLDIKKQELIKSTSDRKVLDKLKEKAKQDFEAESNRKEQKLNDDFALFSYVKLERR